MTNTKVLVVEDEGIVALDLASRLRRLGYDVSGIATSGEDAIQKAAETHPDLVLMDIRLRGKMDGIEAAQTIRARFDVPVIYLTALADEETLQRARATEHDGLILKPFEERELHAAVAEALRQSKAEGLNDGNT